MFVDTLEEQHLGLSNLQSLHTTGKSRYKDLIFNPYRMIHVFDYISNLMMDVRKLFREISLFASIYSYSGIIFKGGLIYGLNLDNYFFILIDWRL